MNYRIILVLLLISGSIILNSCAKKQPEAPAPVEKRTGILEVKFIGIAGEQLYSPGKEAVLPDGRKYILDLFKFYITDLELFHPDGSIDTLADVALLDLDPNLNSGKTAHGSGAILSFPVPVGEYSGIRFRLGLDSTRNAADPSRYGTTHPLSALNGMYWTWKTGYRFVLSEGSIDTTESGRGGVGSFAPFAYHPGHKDLSIKLEFRANIHRNIVVASGVHHYNVEMELDSLFYGKGVLPFRTVRNVHGEAATLPVAQTFMNRLATGFQVYVD